MAKFWRKIRQVLHNVPIPGIGITIQQAKDVYAGITQDPGGTIVYEPPTTVVADGTTPITDAYVRKYNLWFWIAVLIGLYFFLKGND